MKRYVLKSNSGGDKELPPHFNDELNTNQLAAVTFGKGPLLVIAGAGSGKTKTLVYRVARLVHQGVKPERILLLTFTRKSSQEMLKRASSILDDRCKRVSGGTFHSFANTLLRQYASEIGYPSQFTIMDRADAEELVGSIRKELGLNKSDQRFPKKRAVLEILGKSLNTNQSVRHILDQFYPHFLHFEPEVLKIQELYSERKKQQFVMDYDDLLVHLVTLMTENAAIRETISGLFEYIMVDEYQDTNHLQARLISLLVNKEKNIMVVGDDAQSIYSFRGADFKNIMSFPELFDQEVKVITLDQNYRSKQPILALTNEVIKGAKERFAKDLFTEQSGGDKPIYIETQSENDQSRFITQKVLELREEGISLSDVAILFRSSSHSNDLEIALNAASIPFVKYGGFKFTETAHIKDVVAFLRVMSNPLDGVSWQRVLTLVEGIGPKMADTIFQQVVSLQGRLDQLTADAYTSKKFYLDLKGILNVIRLFANQAPRDSLGPVIDCYTPFLKEKYDDYHKRQSDLESLSTISERYDDLETFLTEISLEPPEGSQTESVYDQEDESKLVLSTIHSAKGLEYHTVFILSLVDGYLPSFRSLGDLTQLEEERRLLYVAMTRAKESLFLMKPNLEMGGDYQYNYSGFHYSSLTRFLDERQLMDRYTEKWSLIEESDSSNTHDPHYFDEDPDVSTQKYRF